MGRADQRRRRGDADAAEDADADQDGVRAWVDALSEKGRAKRLHGIGMLTDHLRKRQTVVASGTGDDLDGTLETLLGCLPGLMRAKAQPAEFAATCKLVEVLALVLAPEGKKMLFAETYDVLRAATAASDASGRAAGAMRAIAVLAALCSADDGPFFDAIARAEELIAGYVADEPKIAALQSWGFMASLADAATLNARAAPLRAMLVPLLTHESTEVRAEAGENLALLLAVTRDCPSDDDEDDDELAAAKKREDAKNEEARAESKIIEQGFEIDNASQFVTQAGVGEGDEDEARLIATLEELAHQNEKNVTRRNLREQRARFRSVVASVRDGADPEHKLVIEKVTLSLEGWAELKRAGFLREILGEGLEAQTKANAAVQGLLNLRSKHLDASFFAADGHLVGVDGATFFSTSRSAATKQRAKSRSKARDQREAIKADFLEATA